jgi:hypothetical protein
MWRRIFRGWMLRGRVREGGSRWLSGLLNSVVSDSFWYPCFRESARVFGTLLTIKVQLHFEQRCHLAWFRCLPVSRSLSRVH